MLSLPIPFHASWGGLACPSMPKPLPMFSYPWSRGLTYGYLPICYSKILVDWPTLDGFAFLPAHRCAKYGHKCIEQARGQGRPPIYTTINQTTVQQHQSSSLSSQVDKPDEQSRRCHSCRGPHGYDLAINGEPTTSLQSTSTVLMAPTGGLDLLPYSSIRISADVVADRFIQLVSQDGHLVQHHRALQIMYVAIQPFSSSGIVSCRGWKAVRMHLPSLSRYIHIPLTMSSAFFQAVVGPP